MKVTPEDFKTIETYIRKFVNEQYHNIDLAVSSYALGLFPRADKVKDLNKRFRWDLFWGANSLYHKENQSSLLDGKDYSDAHIDTALRRIVPTIPTQ